MLFQCDTGFQGTEADFDGTKVADFVDFDLGIEAVPGFQKLADFVGGAVKG